MNKLVVVFSLLLLNGYASAQCNQDPTMAGINCVTNNINTNANWINVYGTPTCFGDLAAIDGTSSLWMWSYSSNGECAATPYNFIAGHNYQICYRFKATSNALISGSYEFRTSVGNPSSSSINTVNNLPLIETFLLSALPLNTTVIQTFNFSPSSNTNFLVMRPWMTTAPDPSQAAAIIDDLYVIDLDQQYQISPDNSEICVGNSVTVSVGPLLGCEKIDIFKDGVLACSDCLTFTDTPATCSVVYSAEVRRGIPNDWCDLQVVDTIVKVNPMPIVNAGNDTITSCISSTIQLNGIVTIVDCPGSAIATTLWNNASLLSDSTILNPIASLIVNTTYSLTATTNKGCSATDNISVMLDSNVCGCTDPSAVNYNPLATYDDGSCIPLIAEPIIINVPNVITANGDGSNDVFFIETQNMLKMKITILNRWGNLIFVEDSANPIWNGKDKSGQLVADGTYFYSYEAVGINDENFSGHGFVQVITE